VSTAALVLRADDRLACREWIAHHSKSFYLSSLLLPAGVRQAAWALYAFCRRADDAVDEDVTGSDALRRVDGLRRRLDSVYRGEAQDNPIDRAFAEVVARHHIPAGIPRELLAGMEMDARGASYDTDDDLLRYCFRVASTVGLMMTCVMGAEHAEVAHLRAADLGAAMQLTNIARDIGEDARRGRVYLPRALCEQVGLDERALLSEPRISDAVRAAVKIILDRAEAHYVSADLGIPLLPASCRLAIASSRRIYSRIGVAVAKNGHDSISQRAYVSLPGKLWLVAGALGARFRRAGAASIASVGPADAKLATWIADAGLVARGARGPSA
jgi:phytoene synthase